MCITLTYLGRHIDTMSEAIRLLGEANVVTQGDYPIDAQRGNNCLCPVNVEMTAKMLGCVAVQDEHDPMEFDLRHDWQELPYQG